MKEPDSLLVFMLGGQRYALFLPEIDRVVRMASITPLPASHAGKMAAVYRTRAG